MPNSFPTPSLIRSVGAMVAAGATIHSAIRAAGITSRQWNLWRGQALGQRVPELTALFDELEKARGLALARAQVESLKTKPIDRLKAKRQTPRKKAHAKPTDPSLPWRGWQQWRGLLEALAPWPEARQAAAQWVESLDEGE